MLLIGSFFPWIIPVNFMFHISISLSAECVFVYIFDVAWNLEENKHGPISTLL